MHLNRISRAKARATTILAAAVLAAVPAMATTGQASAAPGDAAGRPTANPDVIAAMQQDLGLTATQVVQRLQQQAKAIQADQTLKSKLGPAFAGSWFDASSGKLVVNLTDARQAAVVRAAGATAHLVKHSMAQLNSIKGELDSLAGKAPNASAAVRVASGKRSSAVAGLTSWYVDAKTNSVVVSTVSGQPTSASALDVLTKYGDAVRVEQIDGTPRAAANFMDGGDGVNGDSCSAGFDLRNPSTGQGYLLIAGHCVSAGSNFFGQGGVFFGPVLESFFPTYDDAIVRNDNPGFWIQGPWVDTNPSNGGVITITGISDAPVGTTLCKSGVRTKLTCGSILVKDETVTFDGTNTVFGETRHSACVRKGDSGGSNFSVTDAYRAEGVTSGAVLYGADLECGAHVGQPTFSWYFPIVDSLAFYGPQLGVTIF